MDDAKLTIRRVPSNRHAKEEDFRITLTSESFEPELRYVYKPLRSGGSMEIDIPPGTYSVIVSDLATKTRWIGGVDIILKPGEIVALSCQPVSRLGEWFGGGPPGANTVQSVRIWPDDARSVRFLTSEQSLAAWRRERALGKKRPSPPASMRLDYKPAAFFRNVRTELVETEISYEPIGEEHRIIDNPSRGSTATRSFRATREWTRKWELGRELTAGGSLKAQFGPDWSRVEGSVNAQIKRSYTVSGTEREEFSEEISVQVAPESSVRLTILWKLRWQHGVVRLIDGDQVTEVPFKIARSISFDQSVTDI